MSSTAAIHVKDDLPLERFSFLRSSSPDDVCELMGKCLSPHELNVVGDREMLDVHLNRVSIGELTIHTLKYGAEVTIDPGQRGDFFMLQLPLRGYAELRSGSRQVQVNSGVMGVLYPRADTWMNWSADCSMIMLCASRAVIERRLGHSHLTLNDSGLAAPRKDPAISAWWQVTCDLVGNVDSHPEIWLQGTTASVAIEEFLLSGFANMLHNHCMAQTRSSFSEQGRELWPLHRAKNYILEHLDKPLRLQEIAQHARVSVRSLELLFKKWESVTPQFFIRQQRLQAVHRELTRNHGRGVTEIAFKHGFVHMSRFAQQYRECFGCSPSETLRLHRL
jgi:AraC-like DNA-binding protein